MLTASTRAGRNRPKPTRPEDQPGELITVTEAAKILRLSRRTIERLVARGALPCYELPIRGG
jgi:excisionase family DNA binding protein